MPIGQDFEEFVAVVEHGTMTAAAAHLGLPRPTLSRRLDRLEARLGVRLLHRSTRRLTLTREGQSLAERATPLVRQAREAEAEVRRMDGQPRGLLRISVPAQMPATVFSGWLEEFLGRYPEVQIEVLATSEHVDLRAEGFDVAMRAGPVSDPSLVVRTLVHNDLIAVAAPAYLARRGAPATPADLAQHDCILGFGPARHALRHWPLRDGGALGVSGRLMANQMGLRLAAAKRGLGIALVFDRVAAEDLASGALCTVLPEVIGRQERVCLAYPHRQFLDPKVRAFVDLVAERVDEAHRRRASQAAQHG